MGSSSPPTSAPSRSTTLTWSARSSASTAPVGDTAIRSPLRALRFPAVPSTSPSAASDRAAAASCSRSGASGASDTPGASPPSAPRVRSGSAARIACRSRHRHRDLGRAPRPGLRAGRRRRRRSRRAWQGRHHAPHRLPHARLGTRRRSHHRPADAPLRQGPGPPPWPAPARARLEDLNMVAGGMVQQAARSAGTGFGEHDVIVQATHTHAGPTGYSNFLFKDRAFPTTRRRKHAPSPTRASTRSWSAGWRWPSAGRTPRRARPRPRGAHAELLGVTRNRSIEAHLADHGIERAYGSGHAGEDPVGAGHRIDPTWTSSAWTRLARGRTRPRLGAWAVFANHGTVNKSTFPYYNGDHGGVAHRVLEAALRRGHNCTRCSCTERRRRRRVRRTRPLRSGGRRGRWGAARPRPCSRAWRAAGRRSAARPATRPRLDARVLLRPGHAVRAARRFAVFGRSYLTGSEEGRGPAVRRHRGGARGHAARRAGGAAGAEDPGAHRSGPHPGAHRGAAHRGPHRRPRAR